jgi:ankyrin repeat protein
LAVLRRNTDLAGLLIEKGSNVNARDDLQETPLHLAALHGDIDIARLLIDNGADLSAEDQWLKTPSDIAAEHGYTEFIATLQDAVKRLPDHADGVEEC